MLSSKIGFRYDPMLEKKWEMILVLGANLMLIDYSADFWLGYAVGWLILAVVTFGILRWIIARHQRKMDSFLNHYQNQIRPSMFQLAQVIQHQPVKDLDGDLETKTKV